MGAPIPLEVRKCFPTFPRFKDFRQCSVKWAIKLIAVNVGTPDFFHIFRLTMNAMSLAIHVYVRKTKWQGLCNEVELMMDCLREHNVVTQMGNQGTFWGELIFQIQSMEGRRRSSRT